MKKFFIHIGLPRTATTFLQTHLFPNIPGVDYYGLPYTQINSAFNRMLFEDGSTYNPELFKSEIDKLSGSRILLSNENFAGQSIYWHFGNRTRIAKRIQEAIPQATIVLFLRNQADLIRSLYLIALQDRETASLGDYIKPLPKPYSLSDYRSNPKVDLFEYTHFNTYHPHEQLYGYDYLPLINLYKAHFPDVRILLFEDFAARPDAMFETLGNIFEADIPIELKRSILETPSLNSGTGQRQANWLRKINKWQPILSSSRLGNALYTRLKRYTIEKMSSPKPVYWNKEQLDSLQEIYSSQNQVIEERYPEIGLSRHAKSYFLES